jgi:hypothetical protein
MNFWGRYNIKFVFFAMVVYLIIFGILMALGIIPPPKQQTPQIHPTESK